MKAIVDGKRTKIRFSPADVGDLNVILAEIIAEGLGMFIKYADSIPNDYYRKYSTEKEALNAWIEDLKKMEQAFRLFVDVFRGNVIEDENIGKLIKEGMKLFVERFEDLWI